MFSVAVLPHSPGVVYYHLLLRRETRIRDFPYYATFREKGAKLACADKLGVFLSLTLCKKASFEYLAFIK